MRISQLIAVWLKADNNGFLTRVITEFYFMDKRQYSSDTLTGKKLGKISITQFHWDRY